MNFMFFTPDTRCDALLASLKASTPPAHERWLRRRTPAQRYKSYFGIKTDSIYSADTYYVLAVNDAIAAIRSGKVGYLFFQYQLRDLVRFEREIEIHNIDGIYHVFSADSKLSTKK